MNAVATYIHRVGMLVTALPYQTARSTTLLRTIEFSVLMSSADKVAVGQQVERFAKCMLMYVCPSH